MELQAGYNFMVGEEFTSRQANMNFVFEFCGSPFMRLNAAQNTLGKPALTSQLERPRPSFFIKKMLQLTKKKPLPYGP